MRNVRYRILILYIFLGAIVGSLIGELANLLPEGVVKEFFLRSASMEITPTLINLKIFSLTFGFTFTLNIAGIIGIAIAVYILRWYR